MALIAVYVDYTLATGNREFAKLSESRNGFSNGDEERMKISHSGAGKWNRKLISISCTSDTMPIRLNCYLNAAI